MKRCVINIDGVLNYYPIPWLNFLKINGYSFDSIDDAKDELGEFFYYDMKALYRFSTMKRFMPVRNGALEFLYELKNSGYHIILSTKRPVIRFPHLEKWTKDWVKRNKIPHDELVFIRDRNIDFSWAEFIIDDDYEYVCMYNEMWGNAYLFDGSFDLILEELKELIQKKDRGNDEN